MSVIYNPTGKAKEFAPVAFNAYRGCSHGCLYCFAPRSTFVKREEFYNNPTPKKNILARFKQELEELEDPTIPITFSFACDPYQPIEEEFKITRQAIEYCNSINQPVNILTKSNLVKRDFDLLLKNPKHSLGMTLTFDNDKDSLKWEPGASLPHQRLLTLLDAYEKGINTWVSIEPVIDPKQSLLLIENTLTFVNHYKVGCINYDDLKKTIDWKDFRRKAEDLLVNKSHYITNSLKEVS